MKFKNFISQDWKVIEFNFTPPLPKWIFLSYGEVGSLWTEHLNARNINRSKISPASFNVTVIHSTDACSMDKGGEEVNTGAGTEDAGATNF